MHLVGSSILLYLIDDARSNTNQDLCSVTVAFFENHAVYEIKCEGLPRQAAVAKGVPDRLRPRIFLTFDTTRVVGRQPYAPAAFTPIEFPGTYFQGLSRPQGAWFCRKEPRKKNPPLTPPGIDSGTVRLVMQRLNHYTTPGSCL